MADVAAHDLENIISDDEARKRSETEARLWKAIDRLPERQRQVLLMSKRDGMRDREIAQELRSEEHTSELQSRQYLVCRLLLEKKKKKHSLISRISPHHGFLKQLLLKIPHSVLFLVLKYAKGYSPSPAPCNLRLSTLLSSDPTM